MEVPDFIDLAVQVGARDNRLANKFPHSGAAGPTSSAPSALGFSSFSFSSAFLMFAVLGSEALRQFLKSVYVVIGM